MYHPSKTDGIDEQYARGRFKFDERLRQRNEVARTNLVLQNTSEDDPELIRLRKIHTLLTIGRDYWAQFILHHYGTLAIREKNHETAMERPLR